jgi:hypothetical protein
VIEGEIIGGKLMDGVSGEFDLESEFTVRCNDGVFFVFTARWWKSRFLMTNRPLGSSAQVATFLF